MEITYLDLAIPANPLSLKIFGIAGLESLGNLVNYFRPNLIHVTEFANSSAHSFKHIEKNSGLNEEPMLISEVYHKYQ